MGSEVGEGLSAWPGMLPEGAELLGFTMRHDVPCDHLECFRPLGEVWVDATIGVDGAFSAVFREDGYPVCGQLMDVADARIQAEQAGRPAAPWWRQPCDGDV